eukprot:gene4651-8224_t
MLHKEKGNEEFKNNNFEKALHYYSLAIKEDPKNEIFHNNRALTHIKLEKYEQAIIDCNSAIKLKKNFVKAHFNKGIALERLNQIDKAKISFEVALSIDPKNQMIKEKLNTEKFLEKKMKKSHLKTGDELNALMKFLPKNSYYDIPNYFKEYKKSNPFKTNLEFIETAYSFRNSNAFHEYSIERFNMDPEYCLKRFGEISPAVGNFLKSASPGSIRQREHLVLQKNMRYNFSNSRKERIVLTPGKTIVSIGFVDLSLFLNFNMQYELNIPVKFVGYDGSLFSVVKTKILIQMIDMKCSEESIVHVWFSSGWSLETKKSFDTAIGNLLKRSDLPNDQKDLLLKWKKETYTRKESQQLWKDHHSPSGILCDGVHNLIQQKDRVDYCEYWATGEILKENIKIGSTIMFSKYPLGSDTAREESVFGLIELLQLKFENNTTFLRAVENHLVSSVKNLKSMISSNKLQLEVHMGFIDINNAQLMKEIKNLNPYTMTWSNVPDYLNPRDFFTIAKKCSSRETIHLFWSMNWIQLMYGVNINDYPPKMRNEMLKLSKDSISKQNILPKFLRSAVISHPVNLGNQLVAFQFYKDYLKNFYSKSPDEVHVHEQTYPIYNPFAHTPTEIYSAFSFDEQNVVSEDPETHSCSYCRKESKKLKKCTRCKYVSYCSIECQKKHWDSHKSLCKMISQ